MFDSIENNQHCTGRIVVDGDPDGAGDGSDGALLRSAVPDGDDAGAKRDGVDHADRQCDQPQRWRNQRHRRDDPLCVVCDLYHVVAVRGVGVSLLANNLRAPCESEHLR